MADGKLWIGTSGWIYKHWMGIFYPEKMPGEQQLEFYAANFETVEVNYSFYHLPQKRVFENWRRKSPEGFLFAVKASRYLTHMKKLKEPEEPMARLMERAAGLEEKLGPILFQFPHYWPCDNERLGAFLTALKPYPGHRWAFEFRHESWLNDETYRLLEAAGAALCIPIHPGLPCETRLTAPWSYIRFHTGKKGVGFTDEELSRWARLVERFNGQGADVYLYFNNDPGGHAIADARSLRKMLGDGE